MNQNKKKEKKNILKKKMESKSDFNWFVLYVLPLLILCFGLIGNSMGLIVLSRKKMDEIGPLNIYRYIFIFDSIYLLTLVNFYLNFAFSIDIYNLFTCKLFAYFLFSFSPISTLILIYILIERYLSISYPTESNLLRNNKIQLAYLILSIVLNLIYFSPVAYYYSLNKNNLQQVNLTTLTTPNECNSDLHGKNIISYLSFFSKAILPLFLIILFSIILFYKITKSKSNIATFYSDREKLIFKKDVHLSIISILFNLIQFSFSLPVLISYYLYDKINITMIFSLNIHYISFAFNFYFLLASNSLFRSEFLDILFKKKTENNQDILLLQNRNQQI